jgi:hypothetical protein
MVRCSLDVSSKHVDILVVSVTIFQVWTNWWALINVVQFSKTYWVVLGYYTQTHIKYDEWVDAFVWRLLHMCQGPRKSVGM